MLTSEAVAPLRPRTITGEFNDGEPIPEAPKRRTLDLTMQVKLQPNGVWHRKLIGATHSACGIPMGGWASRDESYLGELCTHGCFSPFELELNRTSKEGK